MCYTSTISLTTAIIEFSVALILILFFRKSRVNRFFIIFLIFLGFYQFSEFMLCRSGNMLLWAKIGFISYTFLPAVGLFSILRIVNRNYKISRLVFIYILPIFYTFFALFSNNFISSASCDRYFVQIHNILSSSGILYGLYVLYYFGFLFLICMFLWGKIVRERSKYKRWVELDILLAVIFSLLPAIILVTIIPSLVSFFPSIYCEFAILFAMAALVGAWLDSKREKNGKRK